MFSYKRNHALIKDLIKARFNQIVFTSQINQRFSKIFWRRRLPLQQFCFSLRWKIMSRPLLWLHIYRLKEINDNPMVYMVTKERRGSAEAVVIYFASITYHLQKALPINRYFVLSLNGKEWCVTRQNGCMGFNSLRAGPLLCRHERCLPTKKLKQPCVTIHTTAA